MNAEVPWSGGCRELEDHVTSAAQQPSSDLVQCLFADYASNGEYLCCQALSSNETLHGLRCSWGTELCSSIQGFPDSSVGKESACNAGGPSLIPGLGRSAGDGIGSPLQCPRASLVAQLVKNLPAKQETKVPSLGWEDALEQGKATHSSILAWRIPWTV